MATASAPVTGKRKRELGLAQTSKSKKPAVEPKSKKDADAARVQAMMAQVQTDAERLELKSARPTANDEPVYIQIVTGSYERSLHGISARIPRTTLATASNSNDTSPKGTNEAGKDSTVTFSDTFLFSAHASSIRCLAFSPPTESDKRYLATGSSDERINVYSVSTVPPANRKHPSLPSLASNAITENPRNRSLGSLIHHDRAITHLEFPAKGKLFSAAEDNTIAISRTRDWTVLSSIKAPTPKPQGRPSGDTAGPGETPAGVNSFAIHPSQKLMLSVGRGERCLRLWNLMTGKKAGVLNFDRELLIQVGEGKYSSGEGRQVLWDETGENYIIGFERGAAVFGVDSQAKAVIKPQPSTKLHQMRRLYVSSGEEHREITVVSTEDGRLLFFDPSEHEPAMEPGKLPSCKFVAQLGGRQAGLTGRIKDFEILPILSSHEDAGAMLAVTASSDGAIRLWKLPEMLKDIASHDVDASGVKGLPQVGALIATLETGSRITCLSSFVMDGKAENDREDEAEIRAIEAGEDEDEEEEA